MYSTARYHRQEQLKCVGTLTAGMGILRRRLSTGFFGPNDHCGVCSCRRGACSRVPVGMVPLPYFAQLLQSTVPYDSETLSISTAPNVTTVLTCLSWLPCHLPTVPTSHCRLQSADKGHAAHESSASILPVLPILPVLLRRTAK